MTKVLPNKSSSRAGRFKKKLVSEDDLLVEAPQMMVKLAPFQDLLQSSQISEAEFTACYLLSFLSYRFPGSWLGSKIESNKIAGISWRDLPFDFEPNIKKRLEKTESLQEIFANFSLKSTPQTVNRAIVKWSDGHYKLELMFRIPKPNEVLIQQKQGRRCVTALTDQRISKYILGERDALSFTMHDLIHADHFYHNNQCFEGQLGFYGLLDRTISYFDLSNEDFSHEFEYVIADMNAYAVHLMKCLKSAMIHYYDENYFSDWLADLKAPEALRALNTASYFPEKMDQEILDWLNLYRAP